VIIRLVTWHIVEEIKKVLITSIDSALQMSCECARITIIR
jgi:hypothetical protein